MVIITYKSETTLEGSIEIFSEETLERSARTEACINLTPGLTTTAILISFFAGIQLLGLGLLGEYVGRIYDEVKRRPKYILDKKINFADE